jgi:DNA-directed RNA polymerase subunit RPC12/RpoP
MAEGIRFVCSGCGKSIEAWSDGNPFYIDDSGNKKYAYHPNHTELEKCIANDAPHLCLNCGNEVKIDSRFEPSCPGCGSTKVVGTFCLEEVKCPKCDNGKFFLDKEFRCIS